MTRVLATKLFEPVRPRAAVDRPRLLARLGADHAETVTLVAAPAGSGKSTLLGEWRRTVAAAGTPVAWLSVDPADDDPVRFWRHIGAALSRAAPGVGDALVDALDAASPPALRPLVEDLLNELTELDTPLALVLDDLHATSHPDVMAPLGLLLGNLPPHVRALIATRTEPDLPIATWRARGILIELRAGDLRFSDDELAELLTGRGIALADADRHLLLERTEGWAAGVHLAALSLADRDDDAERAAFVHMFAGDHRAVGDYLVDEVLASLPPDQSEFLLATCALDRLCGPLCDAVTGGSDGQRRLEELEAANLFVIPLDDTRTWYRYHHLFADLLRRELRSWDHEHITALHSRAAQWLTAHGWAADAVPHAVAARAWDLVLGIGTEHGLEFVQQGDLATFGQLYGSQDEALRSRPEATLGFAWLAMLSADIDGARGWLDQVDKAIAADPDVPIGGKLDTELLRMVLADRTGSLSEVARCASDVLAMLDEHPEVTGIARAARRGRALLYKAREALWRDDLSSAVALLDDVAAAHSDHPVVRNRIEAEGMRALLALWDGRVDDAVTTARRALDLEAQRDLARAPHGTWARLTLASHHLERLELEDAESLLTHALDVSRRQRDVQCVGLVGSLWAAWLRFAGLAGESVEAVRITRAELRSLPEIAPSVLRRLARADALAHAALGDADAARQVAGDAPSGPTLARIALVAGEHRLADQLATSEADNARSAPSRRHDHVEALCIAAIARRAHGDPTGAHAALGEAERLAAPVGWLAPFVDLGVPMRVLLERAPAPVDRAAARLRTEVLGVLGGRVAASTVRGGIVEPLSERELTVLRRLPSSMSNQEIAGDLFVSLNTVKTQLQSVYRKLGVGSRHEAIERARALGLL